MEQILKEKLYSYLVNNHPDLLISLQDQTSVAAYLSDKMGASKTLLLQLQSDKTPAYIVEEMVLEDMTRNLRPSKYNLILSLLQQDFETTYEIWRELGILTYEILNLLSACEAVFEVFPYTDESTDNKALHLTITGTIQLYLEDKL